MNNNILIFSSIVLAFASAIYLKVSATKMNDSAASKIEPDHSAYYVPISASSADFEVDSSSSRQFLKESSYTQQKVDENLSSDTSEEYKSWRLSKGFFSEDDLLEYKGFKLDKLEDVANQGDLKAIEVLRQYALSSGDSKRYAELVDQGVVYGSLRSVRFLSERSLRDYMYNGKKESDLLEYFAYQQLAVKRGDLTYKYSIIPSNAKLLNFYPTKDQRDYIDLIN